VVFDRNLVAIETLQVNPGELCGLRRRPPGPSTPSTDLPLAVAQHDDRNRFLPFHDARLLIPTITTNATYTPQGYK